jgi:apoptosis-inducing factor 3
VSGEGSDTLTGPDLETEGAPFAAIPDGGLLAGHFRGEAVLLVRKGSAVYAVGGKCTHYGGPLADGLFDGHCLRCPWHHAGFRPESGEAVDAPAIDPLATYAVERRGERIFVTGKKEGRAAHRTIAKPPASVVIVGGGAAGFAAAEMLRREGYEGPVTLVSADEAPPVDRPNLSKDYLAGNAPEDWLPLRPPDWYETSRIELLLGRRVEALLPADRRVVLDDGRRLDYGALLLSTDASPVRLPLPGADRPHVLTLRSLADSRAIVAAAEGAERAVVVGASFIGLEVAASLATRGLEVHVVAPEQVPMERVLGPQLGAFVRALHEQHGVRFHLGRTPQAIGDEEVELSDGSRLAANLVVLGVGVRPRLELAEQVGLRLDRGVAVDATLRTSAEAIWAAGDIARWPDPYSGERIRVEHWVVAERQGQAAARDILGRGEPFAAAPFFWSQHYDVPINYVGHAESWDQAEVVGSLADRDALVVYRKEGKPLAVASIYRDLASLQVQAAMDHGDAAAVEAAIRNGNG